MISSRSVCSVAVTLVVGALAMGCGGDKKTAENPQPAQGYNGYPQQQGQYPQQGQQGQYPQQAQGQYPQQQGQYPQQGAVGQVGPTGAPTATAPAASGAAPGMGGLPVDPNLAGQIAAAGAALMTAGGVAGDPVEAGIKAESARSAPGMTPEGQMAKDQLAADGHKEMLITMQAGKCYTIVGFSPAGQIKDLDLRLLAPPLYNLQAGQDGTTSNTAVIGKGSNPTCPLAPFPLQYKLDIHAKVGAGAFGVQVFSKNK